MGLAWMRASRRLGGRGLGVDAQAPEDDLDEVTPRRSGHLGEPGLGGAGRHPAAVGVYGPLLVRWGQRPPNNHLQQPPQAKGELVRWGQQSLSNHLQQSPQAKRKLVRWGQQLLSNYPQQSPHAKRELVRGGQQLPSNHLQQSPQAKGSWRT